MTRNVSRIVWTQYYVCSFEWYAHYIFVVPLSDTPIILYRIVKGNCLRPQFSEVTRLLSLCSSTLLTIFLWELNNYTYLSRLVVAMEKLVWWRISSWLRRSPATGAWMSAIVAWNPSTPWALRQRSAGRTVFGSWSGERASGSDPSGWVRTSCNGDIPRGSGCYRTGAKALRKKKLLIDEKIMVKEEFIKWQEIHKNI